MAKTYVVWYLDSNDDVFYELYDAQSPFLATEACRRYCDVQMIIRVAQVVDFKEGFYV